MKLKVNASITDFPLYTSMESFFKEFKKAGADGVEIVGGYKNRWSFDRLFSYADKYDLPIVAFHQPVWSGVGLFVDVGFFELIASRGVRKVTVHPLTLTTMESTRMRKYFKRFSDIQQAYGVSMCLENMPHDLEYKKLYLNKTQIQHLEDIYKIGQEYGFLYTFDVSHAESSEPQKLPIFKKMLPSIGVIHVSSFSSHHHHLPLFEGDLRIESFLKFLMQEKYKGSLVLEINHSLFRRIFYPYNFSTISKSISLVRELVDKLS